jgi:hypothetical protein
LQDSQLPRPRWPTSGATFKNAFSDVPTLAAEVTRLAAELQNTRLDRSNLLAAARATIAAHHDGEPDPLSYLRDELDAHITAPRRRA